MSGVNIDELKSCLSEFFGQQVSVDVLNESSDRAAKLVVCNLSYCIYTEGNDRQIRQTAVVLDASDMTLPQFSLSPHKGLLEKFATMFGRGKELNFDDSREFSDACHLQGWVEDAVRTLFNRDVRDYSAVHSKWSVRGQGSQLVIFQYNRVFDQYQIDAFTQQSLEILSLFRDAEAKLDQHPEIRRDAGPEDLRVFSQNVDGIAGKLLRTQLKKISVTQAELDAFLAGPVPRSPPKGVRRQVLGDTFLLIPLGFLFLIGGPCIGGEMLFQNDDKMDLTIGLIFSFVFPLVGGLMAGIAFWYRRKRLRVLREGILTVGKALKIEQSNVRVNHQVRHVVTVEYKSDGASYCTTCNVYGGSALKARLLVQSGQPVTVLVDPVNLSFTVCTDFLIVFEM